MKTIVFMVAATIIAATGVDAQHVVAVTPFLGPGDILRLEVTFDGPSLDDIAKVEGQMVNQSQPKHNQKGFAGSINVVSSTRTSRDTFVLELKVPEMAGDGEYKLSHLYVVFKGNRPPCVL